MALTLIKAKIFRKKKSVHQRKDEALRFIGARISVYEIGERDYELIDHLTLDYKIIASYPYPSSFLGNTIILILERII